MERSLFGNNFIFQLIACLALFYEVAPYQKIYLESNNLCRYKEYDNISVVKLGEEESSSKIVLRSKYFDRWSGKYTFSCSFLVEAPPHHGLYAVFQVLNLRKDEETGLCKDYVEIQIPKNPLKPPFFKKKDGMEKKFCGKISSADSYLSSMRELQYNDALNYASVAENGFVAKDGLLHVSVHAAKEKLNPNEKLDINMVFTSYKYDCNKREKSFQCRDCEWIWEKLYLDKIQNCPYTICLDEDFCNNVDVKNETRNIVSSGTGTKVSIGAVATIILVLLMFACCVWVCRRMQLFCFNPTTNRQSRMEMNQTHQNSRLDENVTPFGGMLAETTAPSAPPISEDKDLPPSYSSLFPGK